MPGLQVAKNSTAPGGTGGGFDKGAGGRWDLDRCGVSLAPTCCDCAVGVLALPPLSSCCASANFLLCLLTALGLHEVLESERRIQVSAAGMKTLDLERDLSIRIPPIRDIAADMI